MKILIKISFLSALLVLVSCGGGSGGTGGSGTGTGTVTPPGTNTPKTNTYTSPIIFTSAFIRALNKVDGTFFTKEVKDDWNTIRSKDLLEDDWFVIYDDKDNDYKAVSLQFIRSIRYEDFSPNDEALAKEFRSIVDSGPSDGDWGGDDYEVVDRLSNGDYKGRQSGLLYEDEVISTDVSLLAKEAEQKKFFKKAANISFAYNLSIQASLSMVTLGSKMENILSRANGELSQEDQLALASDMIKLTGVSFVEIEKASQDSTAREDVLEKIAAKIGTSTQNLESKILPEVFGLTL